VSSIVNVKLSDEVEKLLGDIFEGCTSKYFPSKKEEYLLMLLEHLAQKAKKADPNSEFRNELKKVAIHAHNRIDYGIQLRRGEFDLLMRDSD